MPKHWGLTAIVASAAVAVTLFVQPEIAAAQQKTTILLDWSYPEGIHAGIMLAAEKGWYKQAGLDVDIQDGKGSNATIQQVAAGQVDVGLAQLASMAAAVSNGLPVTSIMGLARQGDNGLVVPLNSGIASLKDLKGKKIATPAGGATSSFVDAFLQAGGISRNDLTIVSVDSSALLSAYTSGAVDGVVTTVGYFLPTVANIRPSKAIMFSDVGLRVPSYGFVVRKDTIDKKAELLQKIVAINQRAWKYIFDGHEKEGADAIAAQRSNQRPDAAILLGQLKAYMALFDTPATKGKPIGWQSSSDWEAGLGAMQKAALVKPGWKVDDYFTNRFIAANP